MRIGYYIYFINKLKYPLHSLLHSSLSINILKPVRKL